ncbi:hypothetical protein OEZ85_000579 [Tetradesmus obliquus]|uniref:Putative auto-transporter adhesin head GIN domain-containing protein n=1 Tax=Tetradesmus obliquus TaxID=3088 RepID=A0ABY8UJ08_TETOB|nr:hypothetical protein OEZ85_000579 [Tetradesmus obliquus]
MIPSAAAAASPSPAAGPEAKAQEPTPGPTGTYTLNPFNAIVACVPFTFLVSPSTDDKTYSVSSSVNAAVQAAVRLRVEDKTLYLGFNQSFESPDAIRINITLPAGQLQRVSNKGMGDIILNPGFKPASAVLAAQGPGRVLSRGLDTQSLEVQSSGPADVFAKGAIATANVTMTGTGRVTLAGVTKAVTAQLEGISSLLVDAASDDVTISAKPSGISKVYYTRGKCDAGQQLSLDVPFFSMDLGLSACVKVQGSAFPRYKAAWSCGMKATGASMCTPGATQQAATAAQGADISVQSVTPDSSGAAASSSSSSSSSSATVSASSPAAASGSAQSQAATVSLLQGPATPAEAEAADAADIGVGQAGHRRLLKTLLLPPLLPLPSLHHHGMFHQPLTTTAVASSSSSDDGNGNTVSVTVGGNGGVSMTVGSVTCSAKQHDLYIAGK